MKKSILFVGLLFLLIVWQLFAQQVINGNRVMVGWTNYCEPATASGTTYACTITGLPAYVTGAQYAFKADVANTAAATINFTTLGAKTIKKVVNAVTTDLAANDIRAGQIVTLIYDGTNMQMLSQSGLAVHSPTSTTASYYVKATATAGVYTTAAVVGGDLPVVGVVVDTSTPVTVSTTLASEVHFNEHATAGTAMVYNLPTAAAGKQFCVTNAYNGSAANTGTLRINTSASGQYLIYTDGSLSASGGYVISGGAARDSACVVGVDATHWLFYPGSGTWTKN